MEKLRSVYVKTLAPLVVLLLGGLFFGGAVVDSIRLTPHPAIVYLIFLIIVSGALLVIQALRAVAYEWHHVDDLAACSVEQRNVYLIKKIQHGRIFRPVFSLMQAGDATVSRIQQAAIEEEITRAENRLYDKLSFPSFLGGSLVGLGLVGTFIGLLGALGDIAKLISGIAAIGGSNTNIVEVFTTLIAQLENPMKSMATAFVASLYGLIGSMAIGFMVIAVRKAIPYVIVQLRVIVHEQMLQKKKNEVPEGQTPAENLQIAITEAAQWKQLFVELRAEHQHVLETNAQTHDHLRQLTDQTQNQIKSLAEQTSQQIAQVVDQTQEQVQILAAQTHEVIQVWRERNQTDELVRRALGEGVHWMDSVSQLQESFRQLASSQQTQVAVQVSSLKAMELAVQQMVKTMETGHVHQGQALDGMRQEITQMRDASAQAGQVAQQMAQLLMNALTDHQQAIQESTAKIRSLLAVEINKH